MKKSVLFLSNSNLFTIFGGLFLHKEYQCNYFNLRYPNEEMTKDEHFIHQIKELHDDFHYRRGLTVSRFSFLFSERLIYRLKNMIERNKPSIIFLEMKTLEESEWLLLNYLNNEFSIPIVTFIPVEEKSKNNMFRLAENGVKEVVTQFDEEIFLNAVKRNLKTQ